MAAPSAAALAPTRPGRPLATARRARGAQTILVPGTAVAGTHPPRCSAAAPPAARRGPGAAARSADPPASRRRSWRGGEGQRAGREGAARARAERSVEPGAAPRCHSLGAPPAARHVCTGPVAPQCVPPLDYHHWQHFWIDEGTPRPPAGVHPVLRNPFQKSWTATSARPRRAPRRKRLVALQGARTRSRPCETAGARGEGSETCAAARFQLSVGQAASRQGPLPTTAARRAAPSCTAPQASARRAHARARRRAVDGDSKAHASAISVVLSSATGRSGRQSKQRSTCF
eukprot:358645-Chlamydomonas_euryale.AAC.13